MNKVVMPCRVKDKAGGPIPVFCKIEITNGKLSISGVIGPMRNGDARGGCGQIDMEFAHRDPRDDDGRTTKPYKLGEDIVLGEGWTEGMWYYFLDVWNRWHLNDMRAGCPHQRDMGWHKERIDESKPSTVYGKHYPGQQYDSWNLKGWVNPPHGHLSEPCPICGYKYGTAWLKEELPPHVIEFLESLPESPITPAWV